MPAKFKSGSFSAFLEDQLKEARQPVVSSKDPFDLLRVLNTAPNRERTVSELMSTANVAFSEFAEMLKSLTGAGLIRLFGEPGAESVALTDKGMAVLDLVS